MALTIGEVQAILSLRDDLTAQMRQASDSFVGGVRSMTDAGGMFSQMQTGWLGQLKSLSGAMSVYGAIQGILQSAGRAAFDTNRQLQETQLQFATLMQSASRAQAHVADLFEIAKTTPFETTEVIAASRSLETFGGAALNTKANLLLFGDAAAAVNRGMPEVSFWIGRAYSAIQNGQPFGEAAMRLQEMAILSGSARLQMEQLQKSGASNAEVWAAFTKSIERHKGAMADLAVTWKGAISTFTDNINMTVAEVTRPLFDAFTQGLNAINALFENPIIKTWTKDAAAAMKFLVDNGIKVLTRAFTEAWDLLDDVEQFFRPLIDLTLELGEQFADLAEDLWAFGETASAALKPVGGAIFEDIIASAAEFRDFVLPLFREFARFLRGEIEERLTVLAAAFANLAPAGVSAIGSLIDIGLDLAKVFVEHLYTVTVDWIMILGDLFDWVVKIGAVFAPFIATILQVAAAMAHPAFEAIIATLSLMRAAFQFVWEIVDLVVEVILDAAGAVTRWMGSWHDANETTKAATSLLSLIAGVLNKIAGWLTTATEKLREFKRYLFDDAPEVKATKMMQEVAERGAKPLTMSLDEQKDAMKRLDAGFTNASQVTLPKATEGFKKVSKEAKAAADAIDKIRDAISGRDLAESIQKTMKAISLEGGFGKVDQSAVAKLNDDIEKLIDQWTKAGRTIPQSLYAIWAQTEGIDQSINHTAKDTLPGFATVVREISAKEMPALYSYTKGVATHIEGWGLAISEIDWKQAIEPFRKAVESELAPGAWTKIGRNMVDGIMGVLKDLPTLIIGTLQGGGDIGKVIGASIGNAIGKALQDVLASRKWSEATNSFLPSLLQTGASKIFGDKIGGFLGDALGVALPGIGSLIGSTLGKGIDAVWGKITKREGRQVNDLRDAFTAAYGDINRLAELVRQAGGDMRAFFAADSLKEWQAAAAQVEAWLGGHESKMQRAQEAAARYGITLDEMGGEFKQGRIDEVAKNILLDFEALNAAGVSTDTIIAKAGDEMAAFIMEAKNAGTTIPKEFEPIIAAMIEAGTLTYTNQEAFESATNRMKELEAELAEAMKDTSAEGVARQVALQEAIKATQVEVEAATTSFESMDEVPFAQTLQEQFSDVMKGLSDLITLLKDRLTPDFDDATEAAYGIGDAIRDIPRDVEVKIHYTQSGGGEIPGYASGSGGIRDYGTGTLAMLHGREGVFTEQQLINLMRGSASEAARNNGAGSREFDALRQEIQSLKYAMARAVRDAVLTRA